MTDGPSIAELRAAYESLGADPSGLGPDRTQHLDWCKQRAREYLDAGDPIQAWASMTSDLMKHDETASHPGITLGFMLLMTDHLQGIDEMREFIEGFN